MEIFVLGTGAALSYGLPYNSFIINKSFLIEAPPDIMISLNEQLIDPLSITDIYISHFHADHIFGIPFLLLNLFFIESNIKHNSMLKNILGPKGIKETITCLIENAFSKDHPSIKWLESKVTFIEVDENIKYNSNNMEFSFYEMKHSDLNTLGFTISENNKTHFAYIPDTIWGNGIDAILRTKPSIIFSEMNGAPEDERKIHLNFNDLLKMLSVLDDKSRIYATHLRAEFKSTNKKIICSKPAMKVVIDTSL